MQSNTKPISSLAAAAAKAKTVNAYHCNSTSSPSSSSKPSPSSNKASSLQCKMKLVSKKNNDDRIPQEAVVTINEPMKSKNERSNQDRHSHGRKTGGVSGGGLACSVKISSTTSALCVPQSSVLSLRVSSITLLPSSTVALFNLTCFIGRTFLETKWCLFKKPDPRPQDHLVLRLLFSWLGQLGF